MVERWAVRTLVVLTTCAILAALSTNGDLPPRARSTPIKRTPPREGSLVFAAEEWPGCLNPVTSCRQSRWARWSVLDHVLPRAMELSPEGQFRASPLLVGEPGVGGSPFTITYHINPRAVWADGTPITSADFEFTWKAILNTVGAVNTSGYTDIDSIDVFDPRRVVVTFARPFVDWQSLFSFILEKSVFSQIDPDIPDLATEMLTGIPFSGGPWILESWSREQAVLIRNERYLGTLAGFDHVVFVPRLDPYIAINSLLRGEVAAIYIEPPVGGFLPGVTGAINVSAKGDETRISAWRVDMIDGPVGRYWSSPYGLFFNMNEWFAAS